MGIFQSKSIKGYIYDMRSENLQLQVEQLEKQKGNEEVVKKYKEKIEAYNKYVKNHEEEKTEISKAAAGFEAQRDDCKLHSDKFGMAVIFLQISILLSSIATLSKKKFVWIISLVLGAIGIFYFLDGFFLLM